MDSPFSYTLITLFFASVMLSIIFLMSWYSMGRRTYTLFFSVSFMVSAALWAVNLGKTLFSSNELYWIIVSSLSLIAVIMGTWGHCLRAGVKISRLLFFSLAILGVSLTTYFTIFNPHIGLRMSLYLYIDVFFLLTTAFVILKHRQHSRPAEIGASIVHALFALTLFIAASIALSQGAVINMDLVHLYAMVNFTSLPAAYVGMSVFVLYMLASDLAEEMKTLAITDQLTGCFNRRGFYDKANHLLTSFKQSNQHVCLIYSDIDNFKMINDQYGHTAGDQVLSQVARRLKQHVKSDDLIGRIGGEEFVILIGRANYKEAFDVAERLRKILASTPIYYSNIAISVTASFGVVDVKTADSKIENAINLADEALYHAKKTGRNKVIHSQELTTVIS
ncbi:GGDEF domain-containing protein [Shewanella sp. HL-SH5]|uniref:GGDEF domain-containing protein n=1 Tax=Shewanella sp. HL-SH5 TaxID=3436241 RepID=UPI003EBBB6B6